MKVFYESDEFPIKYNEDTDELICIGYCMQCPLYIDKGDVDCKEVLKRRKE